MPLSELYGCKSTQLHAQPSKCARRDNALRAVYCWSLESIEPGGSVRSLVEASESGRTCQKVEVSDSGRKCPGLAFTASTSKFCLLSILWQRILRKGTCCRATEQGLNLDIGNAHATLAHYNSRHTFAGEPPTSNAGGTPLAC